MWRLVITTNVCQMIFGLQTPRLRILDYRNQKTILLDGIGVIQLVLQERNGGTASYIESYIKCIIWWHFEQLCTCQIRRSLTARNSHHPWRWLRLRLITGDFKHQQGIERSEWVSEWNVILWRKSFSPELMKSIGVDCLGLNTVLLFWVKTQNRTSYKTKLPAPRVFKVIWL